MLEDIWYKFLYLNYKAFPYIAFICCIIALGLLIINIYFAYFWSFYEE